MTVDQSWRTNIAGFIPKELLWSLLLYSSILHLCHLFTHSFFTYSNNEIAEMKNWQEELNKKKKKKIRDKDCKWMMKWGAYVHTWLMAHLNSKNNWYSYKNGKMTHLYRNYRWFCIFGLYNNTHLTTCST